MASKRDKRAIVSAVRGWHRALGVLAASAALGSCGGGAALPPNASKACDPLADEPQPIALGKVLGVGRDANGILYVIDQPSQGEARLFVSDAMTLTRRPVAGTGSGSRPGGGSFEIVTSGSGDAQLSVQIETDMAGTVAMGVVHGALATKTFTIGMQGETLTVLGADALKGYTLQNLPGTIYVEYDATLADGRTMVVTRPDVDWSYSDFRVFLSTASTSPLLERKVVNVGRGSFTDILFDLDGTQAKAHFSSDLAPGSSTLMVGPDSFELTVMPPGTRPVGLTFLCL
jgi:hypothetical protein